MRVIVYVIVCKHVCECVCVTVFACCYVSGYESSLPLSLCMYVSMYMYMYAKNQFLCVVVLRSAYTARATSSRFVACNSNEYGLMFRNPSVNQTITELLPYIHLSCMRQIDR